MTCEATVVDADGEAPTVGYAWSTGTEGPTYTATDADLAAGSVYCVATATDLDGGSASDTVFAAVSNTTPTIDSISIAPEDPEVGDSVTCDVTARDADGDELTTTVVWADGSTADRFIVPDGTGVGSEIGCQATVTDEHGSSVTASAVGSVANSAPSVEVGRIATATDFSVGQIAECVATRIRDPNGDELTISFEWKEEGGLRVLGDSRTLRIPPELRVGTTVNCTVTATDTYDATASDSASFVVTAAAEDDDDVTEASEEAPEEFTLLDVNTSSPTYGTAVNPRDYLGQVSAYYFGHAT